MHMMASLENRFANAMLTMIRARRRESSGHQAVSRSSSIARSTSVVVREATFADFPAVAELKQCSGLTPDSLDNWERLWRRNPALKKHPSARPIGWVLQADNRIVGYLGNISALYRYGARTLNAVVGHGFVVEPQFRAFSLRLAGAFYRQPFVDLYLTTTAIEAVGRMAKAFKSDPLPQADYDAMLFWVLRSYPFAQSVMKKLKLGSALSYLGAIGVSSAVGLDKLARTRWPRGGAHGFILTEVSIPEIGEDFRRLWEEKANERSQLLADRSPETLRWHFEIPGDKGSARVLCCYKGPELVGYAIVRHEPPNQASGLKRSIIAEILVKQDNPDVLRCLWVAAFDQAKKAGSHILEVLGFPPSIRSVAFQWKPYVRKYPACPFYYRASNQTLHQELTDSRLWYASGFDGDTTLFNFGTSPQGTRA